MIVKLDAEKLIFAIHGSYIDIFYFDTLIDDCKILSNDLNECFFVFIKKITNQQIK